MKEMSFDWIDFLQKLIFPPRCPVCSRVLGFVPECERCTPLIPRLLRRELVPLSLHTLSMLEQVYAPFVYQPPMKQPLLLAKYEARRDIMRFFAEYMAQGVRKAGWPVDVIVPVPSHPASIRRRGHDTALLFAQALAEQLHLPVEDQALKKLYQTKEQHTLSEQARQSNLLGAFAVQAPQAVRGRRILLVDDVLTTGATLNECAKMLLGAGAECCYGAAAVVTE